MARCYIVITILIMILFSFSIEACAGWKEANKALKIKDYSVAYKELKPLAAKGDSLAQYNMGRLYEFGLGVSQNIQRSIGWYYKASEQGSSDSMYRLAKIFLNGKGGFKDYDLGIKLLKYAAEYGHNDAKMELLLMKLHKGGHLSVK